MTPERREQISRLYQAALARDIAMPFVIGTRLWHYQIVAPLGAGGMGEGCFAALPIVD